MFHDTFFYVDYFILILDPGLCFPEEVLDLVGFLGFVVFHPDLCCPVVAVADHDYPAALVLAGFSAPALYFLVIVAADRDYHHHLVVFVPAVVCGHCVVDLFYAYRYARGYAS